MKASKTPMWWMLALKPPPDNDKYIDRSAIFNLYPPIEFLIYYYHLNFVKNYDIIHIKHRFKRNLMILLSNHITLRKIKPSAGLKMSKIEPLYKLSHG